MARGETLFLLLAGTLSIGARPSPEERGPTEALAKKESWNCLKHCAHMIAADGIPQGSATRRIMSVTLADAGESVSCQDIPLG
jgi:hypothetical protein